MSRRGASTRPWGVPTVPHLSPEAHPFLEGALELAKYGFPVVPCASARKIAGQLVCSCPREDCDRPGRHALPLLGARDASTLSSQIKDWALTPNCNPGIAVPANAVLLEVRNETAAGALDHETQQLPTTPSFTTALGGQIYFFKAPAWLRLRSRESTRYPGLRSLACGELTLVPPSIGTSGERYEWVVPLGAAEIAPAPQWLLQEFAAPELKEVVKFLKEEDEKEVFP